MEPPIVTFPKEVEAFVRKTYAAASVILEYGSGGSTWIAAQMPGKLIFSVESDLNWSLDMQAFFNQADLQSPATMVYVNIGETGKWGRPLDDRHWRDFHNYPLKVWEAPFFRHPDVVLIDGRFRAACLVTVLMRAKKPVKVLFDDYVDRPHYHAVEDLIKPVRTVGRMAEFHVEPGQISGERLTFAIGLFGQTTFADQRAEDTLRIR